MKSLAEAEHDLIYGGPLDEQIAPAHLTRGLEFVAVWPPVTDGYAANPPRSVAIRQERYAREYVTFKPRPGFMPTRTVRVWVARGARQRLGLPS